MKPRDEQEERFATEHPAAYLRRREFIARSVALAGAAGVTGALTLEEVLAEAARREPGRYGMPSPRNMPLDTIVVLMMENRSFDHYFGWHELADGRNAGLSYPDIRGRLVPTHHLGTDFQGCGFRDPDHSWSGGRFQFNGGRNDGFLMGNAKGTGSDVFALGYYLEPDLDFIASAARAYKLYDRYFCSVMGPTYPNRHYLWSAQCGGQKVNMRPSGDFAKTGFEWTTIFDRAARRRVSARYYASDIPFSAVYGERGLSWTEPVSRFYEDAEAGVLPNIAFVDPPFLGENGTTADEHPHGDIRLGQAFMADIVGAFIDSPQYRRGALFITYDEWGGFFDHVPPPRAPDKRGSATVEEDFGQLGFRVPAVAVSPFTRGGRVSHQTVAHESILKLISYRFGLGNLNRRHKWTFNIGRTFNFRRPRFGRPALPTPEAIVAQPCRARARTSSGPERPKPHDLVELHTSGFLEQLGYQVRTATPDVIHRRPDAIRQGIAASLG